MTKRAADITGGPRLAAMLRSQPPSWIANQKLTLAQRLVRIVKRLAIAKK